MMRAASERDIQQVEALLRSVTLPVEGVAEHIREFVVEERDGSIVGSAAVERYGENGLLRSVAVSPKLQGTGLGATLVERALDQSTTAGVRNVVLLTTTAREFFAKRFGFEECWRGEYDSAFAGWAEWKLPRCSSAIAMRRRLVPVGP